MNKYRCKLCNIDRNENEYYPSYIKRKTLKCKPCHNMLKRKNFVHSIWKRAKDRAVRDKIPFAITEDDIYVPKYCPLLGIKLRSNYGIGRFDSPSLDRIYPQYGYVPGNVIVLSSAANTFKNNATPEQLIMLSSNLQKIITNNYPLHRKQMQELWPEEYEYDFLQTEEEKEEGIGEEIGGGGIPIAGGEQHIEKNSPDEITDIGAGILVMPERMLKV